VVHLQPCRGRKSSPLALDEDAGEDEEVDEDLSAELVARAERDQAARLALRPGHGTPEWEATVAPVDRDNAAWLREVIVRHGWPGCELVGEAGGLAAFLLAQHAPPDLQEQCLPLLEEAVARGDASPVHRAYLLDRVLMHRSEPQVYGTQYHAVGSGPLEMWTVRDPSGLDQRRAALGLEPAAEYRARLLAHQEQGSDHEDDEPT
jgi:hypothetical protein